VNDDACVYVCVSVCIMKISVFFVCFFVFDFYVRRPHYKLDLYICTILLMM